MDRSAPAWRQVVRAGLMTAMAGLLLAYWRDLRALYGLPKLLCLASGAALSWLGLLWGVASGRVRWRRTPLDLPLAACAACLVLSTWFSWDRFLSVYGVYNHYFQGVLPLALCAALFYAAAQSGEGERPEPLLRAILLSASVCGAYAVAQKFGWAPGRLEEGRVYATMAHPAFLASALLIAVPLSLHFILARRGADRAVGAACLGLAGIALVMTLSRAGLLGAGAGAAVYLALSGRLPALIGGRKAAGLAVGLIAAAALAPALFRVSVGRSDSERLQIWASAVEVVKRHPLLGTGPDTFALAFRRHKTPGYVRVSRKSAMHHEYAHDDLLQAAATAGLLGLAAYLWLIGGVARLLSRALNDPVRRDIAAAVAGAIAGLFLQAKVNPLPLTSLGLAAVLCGLVARPEAEPLKTAPRRAALAAAVLAVLVAVHFPILRQVRADWWHMRALRASAAGGLQEASFAFDKASAIEPRRVEYRSDQTRFLFQCAKAAPGPVGRECLARAEKLGREGVLLSPGHMESWQILGMTLLESTLSGGPDRLDEAEQALEQAQKLDPTFLPVLRGRLRIAQARKDEAKVKRLFAEFQPIYLLVKDEKGRVDW